MGAYRHPSWPPSLRFWLRCCCVAAAEAAAAAAAATTAHALVALVAVVLLNIYLMMHSFKVAGSISQDPKFVVGTEEDLEEQHKQVLSKHMAMNLFT